MDVRHRQRVLELIPAEVVTILEVPDPVRLRKLFDLPAARATAHEEKVNPRVVLQETHRVADPVEIVDDPGIPGVHPHELVAKPELVDQWVPLARRWYNFLFRAPHVHRVRPLRRDAL